jgi:hypothetical protein
MSRHVCVRVVSGAIVAMGLGLFAVGNAFSDEEHRGVTMRDDCDPASFNANVGPGSCIGDGKTTFGDFVADLTDDHFVAAWRFDSRRFEVERRRSLELKNRGGETHTFTRVANFGGGFVGFLNALSNNPTPAPECAALADGALVPQPPSATNIFVPADSEADGPRAGSSALPPGTTKWQCCIHPWMRSTITVAPH